MFNPSDLANFYGTEQYFFRPGNPLRYTDGVKYISDNGASWLVDLCGSYQTPKNRNLDFQLWELKKQADGSWIVTMREDTGRKPLVEQKIEYSDFPIDDFSWYVIDGVMLLKSEY